MKHITTIVAACIVALVPAVSSAGGYGYTPGYGYSRPSVPAPSYNYSHTPGYGYSRDRGGYNGWELLGAAVIGGLIVSAAETPTRPVNRTPVTTSSDGAVLVNGVWMRRVQRCVQNILTDRNGDQYVQNVCNYVYVPVE